jgi:hypothetical protein
MLRAQAGCRQWGKRLRPCCENTGRAHRAASARACVQRKFSHVRHAPQRVCYSQPRVFGARDRRHAFHVHLQAMGLGAHRTRRAAAAHSSQAWRGKHPVGPHHGLGAAFAHQPRAAAGRGRWLARGTHRAARTGVHRDTPPLVHRHGAARRQRRRECAEPCGRQRGRCGKPQRRIRALRGALCGDLHRARWSKGRTRFARTARRRVCSAPR